MEVGVVSGVGRLTESFLHPQGVSAVVLGGLECGGNAEATHLLCSTRLSSCAAGDLP